MASFFSGWGRLISKDLYKHDEPVLFLKSYAAFMYVKQVIKLISNYV